MPKTPDVPNWSRDVQDKFLKFKPGGVSVEDARKAMLQEAEAAKTFRNGEKVPEFIQAERAKRGVGGNTPVNSPTRQQQPDIEDIVEAQPARTAAAERAQATGHLEIEEVQPPPPAPVPTPIAAISAPERQPATLVEEDDGETIETSKFTGRIFKEGREWVAELTYRNGAGTERFTATSQRELNKKLLEAKGHGTVKVQEVNHRIKGLVLGDVPDSWDIFWKEARAASGMTIEEFNAIPEHVKQWHQDTAQAAWITEFKALYPAYYATSENFKHIGQYLNSRKIPLTLHNLELAYRDLTADEILDERPQPETVLPVKAVSVPVAVAAPATVDSAPEVTAVSTAPPPAVAQRKRGTSAIVPGQSSAVPSTESVPAKTEDGNIAREPSEEELRQLRDAATRGDFSQLKRIATAGRKYGRY